MIMMKNPIAWTELILLVLACFIIVTSTAFLSGAPPLSKRHHRVDAAQQSNAIETSNDSSLEEKDKFLRNYQVDTTIQNLRKQLPQLLLKPLDVTDVKSVYSPDVTLTGPRGEELAFGYEELASLSSTLVAATAAARQANAFVSGSNNNTTKNMDTVDCNMAMDASLQKLRVEWNVDLPIAAIGSQRVISKLVGVSDLVLDENGKVCQHKVLDVRLDEREVSAIGETLATLRRVARTFRDSPLLTGIRDSPLTASLLSDLRNGLLQQQQIGANETLLPEPPLYVTDSVDSAFESKQNMTLVDSLPTTTIPPLPGSIRWKSFAASRQAISQFVEYGLPLLSGKAGFTAKQDFEQLFAPHAELKGVDGEVLASGGERIASFYRTMASLRKGTLSGDWKIDQVVSDLNTKSVLVKWKATNPIRVEGRDRFQLCRDSEIEPLIETVQQLELKINGNRVLDPEWFRTFLTTIETGSGTVGVVMVVDLLQQAGGNQPLKSTPSLIKGPPKLKAEAAASFYGILCALHRDLPTLTDTIHPQSPPAAEYLAPNIELRGYLDETLAKGTAAYTQVANVLTASLRTALLTGRVAAEAPPLPKIEFTPEGSIRVSLLISLKVKVTPGESDMGMVVPLKLELVSEYKVNADGKIKEHKLVESRVNGQYTPGDVISRWIKGTTSDDDSNESSATSLLDVLSWARTFNNMSRRQ